MVFEDDVQQQKQEQNAQSDMIKGLILIQICEVGIAETTKIPYPVRTIYWKCLISDIKHIYI